VFCSEDGPDVVMIPNSFKPSSEPYSIYDYLYYKGTYSLHGHTLDKMLGPAEPQLQHAAFVDFPDMLAFQMMSDKYEVKHLLINWVNTEI
jgi:hypothetical protein